MGLALAQRVEFRILGLEVQMRLKRLLTPCDVARRVQRSLADRKRRPGDRRHRDEGTLIIRPAVAKQRQIERISYGEAIGTGAIDRQVEVIGGHRQRELVAAVSTLITVVETDVLALRTLHGRRCALSARGDCPLAAASSRRWTCIRSLPAAATHACMRSIPRPR